MEKKRKRALQPEAEEDVIARSLAAYGERFMQMFSDADEHAARAAKASSPATDSSGPSGSSSGGGSSEDDEESSGASSGPEASDGVAEFVFDSQTVRPSSQLRHQQQQQQRAKVRQNSQPAAAAAAAPAVDPKLERKAFMSSKAAKVHSGASASQRGPRGAAAAEAEEGGTMTREEFLKMQREVELYGAAALDKRSRKRFEAAMLSKLGAKAQKSPRIPAKIGLGMAKKAAKREAQALEAAIDAGMVKRKGLGKKKREEKRKSLDRGLMEDRGTFKAGVMRVKLGGGGGGGGGKSSGGGRRGR